MSSYSSEDSIARDAKYVGIPETLQQAERFREAYCRAGIGAWEWNASADTLVWDPGMFPLFGITRESFQGNPEDWFERIHQDDRSRCRTLLEQARQDGSDLTLKYRVIWPDGSEHTLTSSAFVPSDPSDDLLLIGSTQETTQLELLEQSLNILETRQRQSQLIAQVGSWELDLKEQTMWGSRMAFQIYGLDRSSGFISLKEAFSVPVPEDRPILDEAYRRLIEDGNPYDLEISIVRPKDGVRRDIHSVAHLLRDDQGTPVKIIGVIQDVTDQKAAVKALEISETRLKEAQCIAHVGSINYNCQTKSIWWSDETYHIFGINRASNVVLLQEMTNCIHPDDLDYCLRSVAQASETGENTTLEYRIQRPDGSVRNQEARLQVIKDASGKPLEFNATVQDITERKLSEQALRDINRRLQLFIEYAPAAIAMFDREMRYLYVSRRFITDYRISEANLIGRCHYEVFPEISDRWKEIHHRCLMGEVVKCEEEPFARYNGDMDWVRWEIRPWQNSQGEIEGLILFSEVITERKKAEKAVRDSNDMYRLLADNAQDMISRHATDGTFLYLSPACTELLGYEPEELLGKSPYPLFHPNDRAGVMESHSAIFHKSPSSVEYRFLCKDGSYRWVETTNKAVVFPGSGEVREMLCITRDISARKQMEEDKDRLQLQLVHAQKMESIGRLAGGVAHDFNNMLGVILGYTEMAMEEVSAEESLYSNLEEIRKAALRSADLTRQLLAFARKQAINPRIIDLNATISGTLKMLRRLIGENINLVWKPGHTLWRVSVDPSQIDQILANLAVNARDAIAGFGTLTIQTENVILDEAFCLQHPGASPGKYVRLLMHDTGCGMDRITLEHLFEPFYTTKEVGKGTGLGLATVYGAVSQNHGYIDAQSRLNEGTIFRIYLPQAEEEEIVQTHLMSRQDIMGSQTVLITEDEPAILQLGVMVLQHYGYTVLAAASPEKALALAGAHDGPIHLLITDVVMPGMNGRELRDQLFCLYPLMKVLFMSGYTSDVIADHGVIEEELEFLQKPFTARVLAERVHAVLNESGQDPASISVD